MEYWTELKKQLEELINKIRSSFSKNSESDKALSKEEATKDEDHFKSSSEEYARALGIPHINNLKEIAEKTPPHTLLPYSFVKKHLIVVFSEENGTLLCATYNPLSIDGIEEARLLVKKPIELIYAPREAIIEVIDTLYQHDQSQASRIIDAATENEEEVGLEDESDLYDLLEDTPDQAPAVRLVNLTISEAIRQGASDIHFEPHEQGLLVRLRVDGVLFDHISPPEELKMPIITRLKVMSKMDIAERRLPQDGRIKMRTGAKKFDFRVSTLPIANGERLVLRILDKGNIVLGLDKIGMPETILDEFRRHIGFSEGIVLVTGPTGSGKTTTLYSALSELSSRDTNIMTVEDPVEYRLKGISQMGVHPKIGLTFASGLRHILRQDPDIIMIGEIRDKETAEIAIQSALTGHLVLSTLHTNDAPSAVTRLVDMGVEPYLISSCLIGVLAQRLVRTVCPQCKGHKNFQGNQKCPQCQGSGFYGRRGIYELMSMSQAIKRQIMISPEASPIQSIASSEGMMRLKDHGMELVKQGITNEQEIWRVTRADES